MYCISKDQQLLTKVDESQSAQPQEPSATLDAVADTASRQPEATIDVDTPYGATPFGTGRMKNLSRKMVKYLNDYQEMQERIQTRYRGDVLLIDSIFESGNLLQADRITSDEYHMYM